jgi:hypothetical protein
MCVWRPFELLTDHKKSLGVKKGWMQVHSFAAQNQNRIWPETKRLP